MKQFREPFPCTIDSRLLPANQEDVLFFDIETTGFSADRECVYLIGCIYTTTSGWELRQFFLEEKAQEVELLNDFFDFIEPFSYLIHFNGDGFDIPFLEKRAKSYQLLSNLSQKVSIDLYKEIRPFKKILGLEGLKQKNLELFLGLNREDQYDGGQLIQVYYQYLDCKEHSLLSLLLLHNADDLRGMLTVLKLRSLYFLKKGDFTLKKAICQPLTAPADSNLPEQLFFTAVIIPHIPLPILLHLEAEHVHIHSRQDGSILMKLPVIQDTLKFFYPDYKNYYYLPDEDYAVHKSIAIYVDASHRVKAKASTCYTKKNSFFLFQPVALFAPEFRRKHADKESYFEVTEDFLHTEASVKKYLASLLECI